MAEYIEREALLDDIEQSVVYTVRGKITSAEMRGAHKIIERIKCAPAVEPIYIHEPTNEVRKNDRGYKPNDILVLKEWDGTKYTGSAVCKRVGYMLTDTIDGIEKGYCVLGLKDY